METALPYVRGQKHCRLETSSETYMTVVRAADRIGLAGVASDPNDGDRAASKTNKNVEVLDYNPQQIKFLGCSFIIRLTGLIINNLSRVSGVGNLPS